jgi:CheY-like chemotaxis protein
LRNKRILPVEDNEVNTLIAAELLRTVGMEGHPTKPIDTEVFYAALRTAVTPKAH